MQMLGVLSLGWIMNCAAADMSMEGVRGQDGTRGGQK